MEDTATSMELFRKPLDDLLSLPFDIRLQIYHYCIPRKKVIEVNNPQFYTRWDHNVEFEDAPDFKDKENGIENFDPNFVYLERYIMERDSKKCSKNNSIFLLSRQISDEALDVLYGENIFMLYLEACGEHYIQKNFAKANRQRMRYLLLVAQDDWPYPENVPDDVLWSSILPTLKALRIIAAQPVRASSLPHAPSLEQHMDRWVEWFKRYPQCFSQYLSSKANVLVDTNGRAETREVVKEFLPHGYREIRCFQVGDFIFMRGRFSRWSGYWVSKYIYYDSDSSADW